MDQDEIFKGNKVREFFDESSICQGDFTGVLHAEASEGFTTAVEHPDAEVVPVAAGGEEHLFMVAKHGMDVIPFHLKPADCIQYFPAARSAIYSVTEKVNSVAL